MVPTSICGQHWPQPWLHSIRLALFQFPCWPQHPCSGASTISWRCYCNPGLLGQCYAGDLSIEGWFLTSSWPGLYKSNWTEMETLSSEAAIQSRVGGLFPSNVLGLRLAYLEVFLMHQSRAMTTDVPQLRALCLPRTPFPTASVWHSLSLLVRERCADLTVWWSIGNPQNLLHKSRTKEHKPWYAMSSESLEQIWIWV